MSIFIKDHREKLLKDLVAYTKDPVRYNRRLRMLIQLADYEKQLLEKFRDFQTEDTDDLEKNSILATLQYEVTVITDISS